MANVNDDPALIRKALAGDIEARNHVVMKMRFFLVGLAQPIAVKYQIDPEDLIQISTAKVLQEFHRFRPELGLSFLTYFGKVCWRAMMDYASRDAVIRPSTSWRNTAKTMELGIKAKSARSLDETLVTNDEFETSLDTKSVIEDHREIAAETKVSAAEIKIIVDEALDKLPNRLRGIMRSRMSGQTLAEIGRRLCLTRERVRQLERFALETMRESILEKYGRSPI